MHHYSNVLKLNSFKLHFGEDSVPSAYHMVCERSTNFNTNTFTDANDFDI